RVLEQRALKGITLISAAQDREDILVAIIIDVAEGDQSRHARPFLHKLGPLALIGVKLESRLAVFSPYPGAIHRAFAANRHSHRHPRGSPGGSPRRTGLGPPRASTGCGGPRRKPARAWRCQLAEPPGPRPRSRLRARLGRAGDSFERAVASGS